MLPHSSANPPRDLVETTSKTIKSRCQPTTGLVPSTGSVHDAKTEKSNKPVRNGSENDSLPPDRLRAALPPHGAFAHLAHWRESMTNRAGSPGGICATEPYNKG